MPGHHRKTSPSDRDPLRYLGFGSTASPFGGTSGTSGTGAFGGGTSTGFGSGTGTGTGGGTFNFWESRCFFWPRNHLARSAVAIHQISTDDIPYCVHGYPTSPAIPASIAEPDDTPSQSFLSIFTYRPPSIYGLALLVVL